MDVKKKVHESSTTQKSVLESKETFSTHSNGWGRIGIRGMEHFWRIFQVKSKVERWNVPFTRLPPATEILYLAQQHKKLKRIHKPTKTRRWNEIKKNKIICKVFSSLLIIKFISDFPFLLDVFHCFSSVQTKKSSLFSLFLLNTEEGVKMGEKSFLLFFALFKKIVNNFAANSCFAFLF